jgi:glycosyltransferase involved in cell wall biosynthesis
MFRSVRILYFLDQDLPDRSTQTIQVMNMGVEFARLGVPVRLFVRNVRMGDRDELFAHFGLEPEPDFAVEGLYREGRGRLNRWRGVPFVLRLADLFQRHGGPGTVAYARGLGAIEPARLATIVGRPAGIPVFYEVHKFYARTMGEYYRIEAEREGKGPGYLTRKLRRLGRIRRRERDMHRTVAGLICINRGIEARLRDVFGDARPITTIPSAARAPDRVPGDDERDLDVIYLGDIGPKKGVRILVDAMTRLPGRRLLIHGKGPGDAAGELREYIRERGLADRVECGGYLPPGEVPPLLMRARASVLPYRRGWAETSIFVSPLKIYELMLAGVPLVMSDLPSLREVVRHDETGLLVPPDDPDALADGLRRLLEDRPAALRMAEAARVTAQDHTWQGRARRVLDFIDRTRRRGLNDPSGRARAP